VARPSGVRSLVVTLLLLGTILVVCHVRWPRDDFSDYWTAGKLNASGANPYNSAAMQGELSALGWIQPAPVMTYNQTDDGFGALPIGAVV
jgi:hypothetical protein